MLKHLGFDIEKHMDSYLMLKLVHILSAVVVAGTGIGIAWAISFLRDPDYLLADGL
jgi:hypothetical protein